MTYGGSSYSGGGSKSCGYGIQPIYCNRMYSSNKSSYGMFSGGSPNVSYGGSWNTNGKLYAHSSADNVLEAIARRDAQKINSSTERPCAVYTPNSAKGAYLSLRTPQYFTAGDFLKPGSTARFVGSASEIEKDIKEAFKATTGEELPNDIIVHVLNDKEFKKAHVEHTGKWNNNIMGFSLNANNRGASQVFARADQLDKLMLTIGHEIGHVLTKTLQNQQDEEAKAFAFSLAWMEKIREQNIAGIGSHILPNPAINGLHDTAFSFVQKIMMAGASAWDTFLQLAKGMLTIREQPIALEA